MPKWIFLELAAWLKANTGLVDSRYQTVEQKLMIFLWILAHNESQRNTAHRFQVSQSTVSEVMGTCLDKFKSLHRAFVRPNEDDWLDPEYELDPKLNAFNGCIGAIDGTHIHAFIPVSKQLRWRNRKGVISQNVFAAVRSDLSFSYILAGAEGSINDASLLREALERKFHIPKNRFYLADAGFAQQRGVIVPFPNVRYHLQDWRNAPNPPETAKELYNLRHARIRTVVEQAFGILKRRYKIVRSSAPEYPIQEQKKIVFAVTALHNFILAKKAAAAGGKPADIVVEELMEKAKIRADRVLSSCNEESDRIRHLAAVLMWKKYIVAKRAVARS